MAEFNNNITSDKLYTTEAENANMAEFEALNEEYLTEVTRAQLVSNSRNAGPYKNQSKGKNRFDRKRFSKLANQVKSYNQLDMNEFFKSDILQVKIPVTGETDTYDVTIKLEGIVAELAKNIKSNQNKLEYKTIIQSITKVFNMGNVYVKCSCEDFCLQADTKIKLLDGTTVTVEELEKKFKTSDKPIYLYSVDESGDFKPGKIKNVWISGSTNKLLKVTLDNDKEIVTTPDHPYMLRNGNYLPAKDLQVGQSLMPLYFSQTKNGYETVKANSKATTEFYSTYKQVAAALLQNEIEEAKIRSSEDRIAIHHKDFNKNNNSPDNLYPMGFDEHYKYHYDHVMDAPVFEKFKAAGELNHKIIKIEYLDYDLLQPVYDIEVEKYHNFYVDAGVILHNCYRFDHWSIINGYGANDSAHDPGPGKGIANPNNDKGIGCKHILLVLANGEWIMKVASVINNYIHYAEEKLQKAFLKIIFPKLYGVPAEDMSNANLLDKETAEEILETKASFIDAINEYGKNRGKYKAGSNKNPITGTGGRPSKTTNDELDTNQETEEQDKK